MFNRIPTLSELRARRDDILRVASASGAVQVRVFGSVARGDATPDSDIDLLVDFREGATMFDAVRLWRQLSELLGHPVNVVAEDAPTDRFMRRALDEAVPL